MTKSPMTVWLWMLIIGGEGEKFQDRLSQQFRDRNEMRWDRLRTAVLIGQASRFRLISLPASTTPVCTSRPCS